MGCPKALVDLRVADDFDDENNENEVQFRDLKRSVFATYQYEILIVSVIVAIIITLSVIITIRRSNSHSYIQPKRIKR